MADKDNRLAAPACCSAEVVWARARGEPLVDGGRSERKFVRGLAGTEERARDDGVRRKAALP
jgi:hypothetical protein